MAALIFCCQSRPEALDYYYQYEGGTTGVVIQNKSYWRVRSTLGRVLGCLPGVNSVGGWIGPCPAAGGVEVPRTIFLTAKQVTPVEMGKLSSDQTWQSPQIPTSATDLKDDEQWIFPRPLSPRSRNCKLLSESRREFRAQIRVEFGGEGMEPHHEEYTLLHNSIFITLPPCLPGQNGAHKDHVSRLHTVEFSVENLKEHPKSASMDETLIINATGQGAEVAARAWCAQVGRHAIVRKADGPCMACTLRGGSRAGLGMGTVI
ncbi:hypothetical protein BJX62DRAFT_243538 [Aspergillus germanicus]